MIRLADLVPEARAAVEAVLAPGETTRWIGVPDSARSPGAPGATFTPVYIWFGIVGLWQAGALIAAIVSGLLVAWYYVAVGCLFMAVGGLFYWRTLRERHAAEARIHMVTDRRVVTIDLAEPSASLALRPAEIGYAEPDLRPDGYGDIEIGHGDPGTPLEEIERFHHFRGVSDVQGAIKALRRLMADHGRSLVTEAPDDDD
jgi:hypothetical protein